MGIAKANSQHQVRGTFADRTTFNQRGFKRENIPQYTPSGKRIGCKEQIKLELISRAMVTKVMKEITEVKVETIM